MSAPAGVPRSWNSQRTPRRQRVSGQLTMYTTPWCGYCRNLKRQLARDGIEMVEVDIERDEAAAEFVMSVNGGNQTVPTVLFPDGTALTNPSAAEAPSGKTAPRARTRGLCCTSRLPARSAKKGRRPSQPARRDTVPAITGLMPHRTGLSRYCPDSHATAETGAS